MVTLNNVNNKWINGSLSGKPFAIPFSAEKWTSLNEMAAQINSATSVETFNDLSNKFNDLLLVEDFKNLLEQKHDNIYVDKKTNRCFIKLDQGTVLDRPLPLRLMSKIEKSIECGMSINPLIKFWTRTLANPNYSDQKVDNLVSYIMAPYVNKELRDKLINEQKFAHDVATEAATTTECAISLEGLILTYKWCTLITHKWELDADNKPVLVPRSYVTNEINEFTGQVTQKTELTDYSALVLEPAIMRQSGDAFHCGDEATGHHIRIGKRIWLDSWDQVNTNDHHVAVKGLHAGKVCPLSW